MIRAVAFVVAFGAIGLPAIHAQGPRRALLVGVNRYDHPKLPNLTYAENDVVEMGRVLADAGYDVTTLCDSLGRAAPARAPTRANIAAALAAVLAKCARGDTVLIAFAGHGLQFEDQKDAFFCPSDAKPFADETATLISMAKVYSDLDKSFASVKLLLVDACRNDPNPNRSVGIDAVSAPPPKGVAALFSCSAGQRAFEHASLKHGVFFHYVLEGLRGEAKNKDGEVTFGGLSDYVQKQVSQRVPALVGGGATQSPNFKADLSGEPPVLVKLAPPKVVAAPPRVEPKPPAAPRKLFASEIPKKRTESEWVKQHEGNKARARAGGIDVLFLGDYMTRGWEVHGKNIWNERFVHSKAAPFGVYGDATENVLWRIGEGKELAGISPKAVVLMIGANNLIRDSANETDAGVRAVVKSLQAQMPGVKVLVVAVLPHQSKAGLKGIRDTNRLLAPVADGRSVWFVDPGPKYIDVKGQFSKELMYDQLHLTEKGYGVLADVIEPVLKEMLKR